MLNTFPSKHSPTRFKQVYFPSMLLDSSFIECKLVDLPVIKHFPATSEEEWKTFKHFGLRSADAYILIYNVNQSSSFQFIETIREQISSTRAIHDTPIFVAANKTELGKDDPKQDIAATVRRTWHTSYVECSAKYNWNISNIFKEVAREVIKHRDNIEKEKEEDIRQCCSPFR